MQDDDLDVLPTDIDDHVRIVVKLQSRLRVRDGFNQGDIGLQHIFQNIFRVARRGHAKHFHLRALGLHLAAKTFEHVNGVLNRIAIRELVRLAQNVAILVQQDRLR